MINELAPEPWFRENYQIWLYNYPTGNPWIFSSMKFRELMREACAYARTKGDDRNLNRMVVVSHSMGGLLTRSSVTDPKTRVLRRRISRNPSTSSRCPTDTRKLIRDATLYQPLTEPKRVVFLAVPHRGSPMANLRFSTLDFPPHPPAQNPHRRSARHHPARRDGDVLQGEDPTDPLPTSINSLSPNNRATVALNKLALPGRITFHSVIGDRGKGDTPDSSDGIVPYWSSHVTPVASELIVPSNHSVPDNAEAAAELKRILKLHLKSKN